MIFDDIARLVRDANRDRDAGSLNRRALKLLEELGEVAQAYLAVTSAANRKAKTWDDVREELADCLIVVLDIAWTVLPWESEVAPPMLHTEVALDDFGLTLNRASYHLALYASSLDLHFGIARHTISKLVNVIWQIAANPLDDQIDLAPNAVAAQLKLEVERKLRKWDTMRAVTPMVSNE